MGYLVCEHLQRIFSAEQEQRNVTLCGERLIPRKLHCRCRFPHIALKRKEKGSPMHNALLRIYLKMQNLRDDENGQDLIEYALVAALIAVVSVSMLRKVGSAVNLVFSNISSGLA